MEALAAFKLDLGGTDLSRGVMQLAIPTQGETSAVPGDEVYFFRKGTVPQPDGSWADTWWLVDNGFIGADGVARTASPPYPGVTYEGEYMVTRRLPGVIGGPLDLIMSAGVQPTLSFGGLNISAGSNITAEVLGILAGLSTGITASRYYCGVPQFGTITKAYLQSNTEPLDLGKFLPPAVTPYGTVSAPRITDAVCESGSLKFTVEDTDTSEIAQKSKTVVRALFADGTHKDVQTLTGKLAGVVLVTTPPKIAVASVRWQLVRQVSGETLVAGA
jgi:hypothetical protein